MAKLLMIAPAPVIDLGQRVVLDAKFAEGMEAHAAHWDGTLDCILSQGAEAIAFPVEMDRASLPWELRIVPCGSVLPPDVGDGYDLIAASGDAHEVLHLSSGSQTPVVYTIEYTHRTRLDILALERGTGPARRLRRRLWLEVQERRRRTAFRAAAALQCNGYPSANAYRDLVDDLHLYLDNRMTTDRFVTAAELDAREVRSRAGGELRLAYSGRLDPMKGAQDLVPLASALASMGVEFRLDIFGDGELRNEIREAIGRHDLSARVRLHAPVDFATALVPWMRQEPDVFVSCHRQGDPSCTYIESMGCGLPIAGYSNEMWGPLCKASGGGWSVPRGDVQSLASCIATLDRPAIARAARAATKFALQHDFESTIKGRMAHLAGIAARRPLTSGAHSP